MLFKVTVVSPVEFIYVRFKYDKNDWLRNRFYYYFGMKLHEKNSQMQG